MPWKSFNVTLLLCLSGLVVRPSAGLPAGGVLEKTGQDAFAAIAEVASLLGDDPDTDWSRVNLLALREHLVDMEQVVLRATVVEAEIDGGVRMTVTGEGRTLDALRRMIPMHVHALRAESDWEFEVVEHLPDGFVLQAKGDGDAEVVRLRGLGFFGLLVAGDHHQRHHLALARGQAEHRGSHGR